jgi:hypothetical protein
MSDYIKLKTVELLKVEDRIQYHMIWCIYFYKILKEIYE